MEGDDTDNNPYDVPIDFYPRPHMEGDGEDAGFAIISRYFYPRPHMEGDAHLPRPHDRRPISTHALTWRATICSYTPAIGS